MRFLVTSIFSVLILAIFLSLGFWQMRRLVWKTAVLADIETRIAAVPVQVPRLPDPDADAYLPVTTYGRLGATLRVLASTRDAGPVYRIIRVLELDPSKTRVMVDLGIIPVGAALDLNTPTPVTITGNLHWPQEVDNWTPAPDYEHAIFFARDLPVLARQLGTAEVLIVARDVSPPQPAITPLPVTSEGIPNRHLEYMVTWFLLAATWVMMTGFALWRMKRRTV